LVKGSPSVEVRRTAFGGDPPGTHGADTARR
jgi:hypothetical protein